jgi:hypothetical protein
MLTKDQFLDDVRNETRIIQHLATKVLPGTQDWRPTPGQRSMKELMQYLTHCASTPVSAAVKGNWDDSPAFEKQSESVTPANFAAAMDAQMRLVESLVEPISDGQMQERDATLPWGARTKLGPALLQMGIKPLVSYRMQFFLYIKQSGNGDIGPSNCWIGVDRPKPAA